MVKFKSVYLYTWPLMSLEEKNALKGSTKFKNEKFILHAGIFDQEKPRKVGKFCSLLCMDVAWEMCTAYTNCRKEKQFIAFKKKKSC